jgi:dethiobiotin synthase
MRGVFVTGTDTGVGKTVVSAALLCRHRGDTGAVYWKPVQTGIESDDDTATVRMLASARAEEVFDQGIRLPKPVSPHLAAEWAGTRIAVSEIVAMAPQDNRFWIVEGAGGALVPLNESESMRDLMECLGLPVVVAARSAVGTINHTLLTLEALRRRKIAVKGVILVGDRNADNRAAIERFGEVSVLAQMPRLTPLTPETLEAWAQSLPALRK